MKRIKCFAFVLMVLMLSSVASALPLTVDSVELDDVDLSPNAVNRFNLERNQEYEVVVVVTPEEDIENVEVEMKISGYEYGDIDPIYASSHVEDLEAGVTEKYELKLRLPEDVTEGNYRLRLRLSDQDGDVTDLFYNLKLDVPRHRLVVSDVLMSPGGSVMAGQGLLVTVRLENEGAKEEEDVRVEVRSEDLGISAVDYVDSIDSEDEEETEEMFMRVPLCTATGTYPLDVMVIYDQGHEKVATKASVTVLESSKCEPVVEETNTEEPVVVVDTTETEAPQSNTLRKALEVVLLALVALIVIVGLIIGFSKLKGDEDEF